MKNEWMYFTGTGISSLGDGLQSFTTTWMVYTITGNPLSIGGMIAVSYLPPLLLAPWAGVYTDRHDAKRLSVAIDLLRTVIVLLMALLLAAESFSLVLFYVLQMLLAIANTLFKPASQALVKETFTDGQLVFVLTKASSLNQVMTVVGTGAGGMLVAFLPMPLLLVMNAGSFAVSAVCNGSLRRVRLVQSRLTGSYWKQLGEGVQFIFQKQGMMYLLFLSVISSASMQMTNTLLAPFVDRYLGAEAFMLAVVDVVFTLGGACAGLFVDRALRRWRRQTALFTLVGMAVFAIAVGIRGQLGVTLFSLFGLGFFTMFHLVTMQTLIQLATPKELIGRITGLRSIIASSTKIGASLTTGALLLQLDVRDIFWGFAGLALLTLLTARRIRILPLPESLEKE